MDSSQQSLTLFDFLDRMRNPASIDLVRSIKSFIVSLSFHTANSEADGKKLQDFLSTMEGSIRDHPLWAGAMEEEIDCALEGLEKYVMTKLFSRTFAVSSGDIKIDQQISEKISLLQNILRPEHLDIPSVLHNEASWLLAEKVLQEINAFKAPHEKLLCILNCCHVINNFLLNVSMSENRVIAGADDFLPVLIYVTIKSLSMDETEFQRCMDATANKVLPVSQSMSWEMQALAGHQDPSSSSRLHSIEALVTGSKEYPSFLEAEAGELTVGDVEKLLGLYKDLVTRYTRLCRVIRGLAFSYRQSPAPLGGILPHEEEKVR